MKEFVIIDGKVWQRTPCQQWQGGKGGGGSAPAQDPLVGIAALKNAEIGAESLAFYKQIWADQAPQREQEYRTQQQVTQRALETQDIQNEQARDAWAQYKTVFQPLETEIATEAREYDTPERREDEAGRAIAEVGASFDAAEANRTRTLQGFGLRPDSGANADSSLKLGIERAKAEAGAGTTARRNVETMGYARKMDAAGLGRGVVSNNATSTQLGLQAGGQASGATSAAGGNRRADMATMQQGYGLGMQGWTNAGNISNAGYQTRLGAYNAEQQRAGTESAGWGQAIGTVAGIAVMY